MERNTVERAIETETDTKNRIGVLKQNMEFSPLTRIVGFGSVCSFGRARLRKASSVKVS